MRARPRVFVWGEGEVTAEACTRSASCSLAVRSLLNTRRSESRATIGRTDGLTDGRTGRTDRRTDVASHPPPRCHPTPQPPSAASPSCTRNSPRSTTRSPARSNRDQPLRQAQLRLPRRPATPPRPLHHLDPQGQRQDRHPPPHPQTTRALPTLVREQPPPTPAHFRTREALSLHTAEHAEGSATHAAATHRPRPTQPLTPSRRAHHTAHSHLDPYARHQGTTPTTPHRNRCSAWTVTA